MPRKKTETFEPRPAQLDCAGFMLENPCSGAFLDVGEGKTSITCMVMEVLRSKKMFKGMLLVTTKSIVDHDVWPKEIEKFGWNFTYTILHGKDKLKNLKSNVDIYIINFEGLFWLVENIKHLKADMLVIDESDHAKSFRTARFKLFKEIIWRFQRRHLLTATPNAESYMDLFAQIFILDEGERLGRYITHFRNKYFYPSGFKGYKFILQEDGAERIHKAIADIVYRPEENSVKLPPPDRKDIVIKLPKKIREQYNELEEEFYLETRSGIITAVHAASKRSKLKQMCNGSVYDEKGNVIHIHNAKINALKKEVEKLKGKPILIGYEFKHDLQSLLKAFPDAPFFGTTLEGKKPNKVEKNRIEDMWNRGKIPVLLGQIESVAHGLNLQKSGHHLAFFGHIDKNGKVIQFIGRLRRSGQKNRVVIYRFIIEDSVDEDVIANNEQKNVTQSVLLNAMKKRLQKRGLRNGKTSKSNWKKTAGKGITKKTAKSKSTRT